MRVVDSRSGRELAIGDTIQWGDGEQLTLVDVDQGLLSASAFVDTITRDHGQDGAPHVRKRYQLPLIVRWLHPSYFFERVAFIPS